PYPTPMLPRRSFLFKLQIIQFTGILTGNVNLIKTCKQPTRFQKELLNLLSQMQTLLLYV
ncbi:hypothetical protein BSK63_13860, partial [Paenibacillus odorifer]